MPTRLHMEQVQALCRHWSLLTSVPKLLQDLGLRIFVCYPSHLLALAVPTNETHEVDNLVASRLFSLCTPRSLW